MGNKQSGAGSSGAQAPDNEEEKDFGRKGRNGSKSRLFSSLLSPSQEKSPEFPAEESPPDIPPPAEVLETPVSYSFVSFLLINF